MHMKKIEKIKLNGNYRKYRKLTKLILKHSKNKNESNFIKR